MLIRFHVKGEIVNFRFHADLTRICVVRSFTTMNCFLARFALSCSARLKMVAIYLGSKVERFLDLLLVNMVKRANPASLSLPCRNINIQINLIKHVCITTCISSTR